MFISISEYVLMATQAYHYYRSEGIQPQTLSMAGFSGWNQVNHHVDLATGFSATTFEKDGRITVTVYGLR